VPSGSPRAGRELAPRWLERRPASDGEPELYRAGASVDVRALMGRVVQQAFGIGAMQPANALAYGVSMERSSPGLESTQWPIVALVASAGGLQALSTVLAGLTAGLPANVLALLHIAPDCESVLPSILGRVSALDVRAAADGDQLTPGRVLVAPAGRHMLVTCDRRIALIVSGAFPPSRPSADLLLTTLATATGPRAIAVVLSGGGHDGATGATAVHRFGGTVVATNEATSTSFAMPAATHRTRRRHRSRSQPAGGRTAACSACHGPAMTSGPSHRALLGERAHIIGRASGTRAIAPRSRTQARAGTSRRPPPRRRRPRPGSSRVDHILCRSFA
jgi:two-component system, chemotaxis family, protein-glutamate methylesterase/glutaminase